MSNFIPECQCHAMLVGNHSVKLWLQLRLVTTIFFLIQLYLVMIVSIIMRPHAASSSANGDVYNRLQTLFW